jgi:hypothetical protein
VAQSLTLFVVDHDHVYSVNSRHQPKLSRAGEMKRIVATAFVTGFLLAATGGAAHAGQDAVQAGTDQIATQFKDGGAWFVATAGKNDAVAAEAERLGVVLSILGFAGLAIVVRIRLRAATLVQFRVR